MITTKVKEWGNSIGVIIPKDAAERLNIKPGDEISMEIEKKGNALKEIFGTGRYKKTTEELLNETRKNESKYW